MKVCPVCQRSCSDALKYCPNDEAALVPYDLRAGLRARRGDVGSSGKETFVFLLPEDWLPQRLGREVSGAVVDLKRNPRLFLTGMLRGDVDPRYRHSMGLSVAGVLTAVSACFTVALLIVGLLRPATAGTEPEAKGSEAPSRERDRVLTMVLSETKPKLSTRRSGSSGGSLSERKPSQGGGGGGDKGEQPGELGRTAVAALQPVIMPPSPRTPTIEHAAMIVPATVYADPRSLPAVHIDVGDLLGREGTKSPGPGKEFGIGQGTRGGIGPNDGPGFGPGLLMGSGGGRFGPGGGPTNGSGRDDEIPWANGRVSPTIVYKEKARYTEEARQQHIQGTVILRATFSADGRITDIRVVRGLPNGLTENAIVAAQRIRFQPALNNGVPITVRASLEFNFALY